MAGMMLASYGLMNSLASSSTGVIGFSTCCPDGQHCVTFHSNYPAATGWGDSIAVVNGIPAGYTMLQAGKTIPDFLVVPPGYQFSMWNTAPIGNGEVFTVSSQINGCIHVYAIWTSATKGEGDEDPTPTPPPTQTPTPTLPPTPTPSPTPTLSPPPTPTPTPTQSPTPTPTETPTPTQPPTPPTPPPPPEGRDADREPPPMEPETPTTFYQGDDGNGSGNGNGGLPEQSRGVYIEDTVPKRGDIQINDVTVPHVGFGDRGIMLFPPSGGAAWALMNLVLSILGSILAIGTAIRAMLQKKRERDEGKSMDDTKYIEVIRKEEADEKTRYKQHRPVWLAVTVILAIAAILVFILTQDMRNPMCLLDWWTIVHAILFAMEIVAIAITFKREKEKREEAELNPA